MVLYRKYRPQKISEIDNSLVREKLKTILSSGRVPHAFLFSGPKGTGKTSSARVIGKSVNCQRNNGRGEPCNRCDTCISITNGNNLDVLEIDAASNRGIDEIRDLREKIRFAPSYTRKKVYIIDEVQMLTTEAFNALLKTLEEPPEHALFVLCTTLPEKLPETIISRCTRIDFKKAQTVDLLESLKRAERGEKREIEERALTEIALRSEGSYRDAHKLLEEVLAAYPRAKITLEMIKKVLGEREFKENELLGQLAVKDAKNALLWLKENIENGADLRLLTSAILETLHAYLLKKYGFEKENFSYDPGVEKLDIASLKSLISLFSQASQELKSALIPQLPLELAIVEWCESSEDRGQRTEDRIQRTEDRKREKTENLSSVQSAIRPPSSINRSLEEILDRWEEILAAVKPHNHSVAGLLRSCKPASFNGETLTLETFYKFHFDRLSETKVRELLEKVAGEIFGKKIQVLPRLMEKKA